MKLESTQALARTHESIRYGESLMEAIDLSDQFKEECEQYQISLEIY